MQRRSSLLPSFQGVAPGQTATLSVPIGLTYHQLQFRMVAGPSGSEVDVPIADFDTYIDEIRVVVNGDAKIRITAAELVMLNQYYGVPMVTGSLPLLFSQPRMRTAAGEDVLAYGTVNLASMTVEVELKAGSHSIQSFKCYAITSPGTPLGAHWCLRRHSINVGAIGNFEIADVRKGSYGIMAKHLSTDAVNNQQFEANNIRFKDEDRVISEAYYRQTGREPQTGWTHMDHAAANRIGHAFLMDVQDARIRYDLTATGNFDLLLETIEGGA